MSVDVVLIYEDTTTCKDGHPAQRRVLKTATPGTTPVALIDCAECDRSKCNRCSRYIKDRRTKRCPSCGSALAFTV